MLSRGEDNGDAVDNIADRYVYCSSLDVYCILLIMTITTVMMWMVMTTSHGK